MFCPNCAARQAAEQNFCRSCGLELAPVARVMELHGPSAERAAIEQRRDRIEKLGYFSITIAGVIAVSLVLGVVAYFKLVLFGPEVLLWSAVGALIGFVLLAAALLGYSNFVLMPKHSDDGKADAPLYPATTNRLIANKPIDDMPSVTEDSTDLLETLPRKHS